MLVLVDTPTRNRAGCIDELRIIGPNADTLLTDYRAWPENNFPRPHSSPPLFFSPSLSFPPSLFLFPSFLRRGPPGFFPSLLFSFFTLPVHQGFHLLTRALSPRGVEKDTGPDHVLLFFPPFISFFSSFPIRAGDLFFTPSSIFEISNARAGTRQGTSCKSGWILDPRAEHRGFTLADVVFNAGFRNRT